MKVALISGGVGIFAFLLMAAQTGFFSGPLDLDQEAIEVKEEVKVEKKEPAKYPEALAPAIRGNAVPQAAEYQPAERPHRLTFVDRAGKLHPWQEYLEEDWAADAVENTELLIVVSEQQKSFVSIQHYPKGAPPVERFQFDLEIGVVVPQTGRVLAKQFFQSFPRPIKKVESWELTKIGTPVAFRTVFNWISARTQIGFPQEPFVIVRTTSD